MTIKHLFLSFIFCLKKLIDKVMAYMDRCLYLKGHAMFIKLFLWNPQYWWHWNYQEYNYLRPLIYTHYTTKFTWNTQCSWYGFNKIHFWTALVCERNWKT